MTRFLVALIALAACGREPLYTCDSSEFRSVYSEVPIDCQRFTFIAQTSRDVHVAAGTMTDQELSDSRAHTEVHILAAASFGTLTEHDLTGYTDWEVVDNKITLGAGVNMASLPHEELHNHQVDTWVADTSWHGRWTELGYWGVADVAEWWLDIPRLCKRDRTLLPSQRQGLLAAGWDLAEYDSDPCD